MVSSSVRTFGATALAVKVRPEFLRDVGPRLNPFGAFLQGLESQPARTGTARTPLHLLRGLLFHDLMYYHLQVYLEKHPKVEWVSYLKLPSKTSST